MATLVRLTQDQIDALFAEAEQIEALFKELHTELEEVPVPDATLRRFTALHSRYTSSIAFLQRQRELGDD
jgi:Mg2+ and Co2+ transporter CorA